ncbi:MAG TPA: DEAD/DEAH box helicase, partial [Dehalococcoidia bacterium]|nr:DEAD/DEAH box helicase [Dehalococcoidia bacterium]
MILRRKSREPVDLALADLRRAFAGRIGWSATLPAAPATYAEPNRPLPPELRVLLRESGVPGLYPHQAEAFAALDAGEDVLVATPTASGKTLAFALPILARLLREPAAKALLVVPTNALANDQLRAIAAVAHRLPGSPRVAVFTGASDEAARRGLRSDPPSLLITNPEMLHLSLCGQHRLWRPFWSGLRFLVLDELHLYRGVFGAHMALLVRRALRIAGLYGARPQVVGCSATVGNPQELGERLSGRRLQVVRGGGTGRGARTLAALAPPAAASPAASQTLAVELFCGLVERGIGTILFALTRRGAELMSGQARERLGPALADTVAPYRGGLAARERERIEAELKSGRLRGVVATNALEVGIDIGGLDAAVIAGF